MNLLIGHPGLRGDLFLNLPLIDWLKGQDPSLHIDMPIYKAYADCAPLFLNQGLLNATVILDSYDDFPNARDRAFLNGRYHKVLNPMAAPRDFGWHQRMHQAQRVADDYGFALPYEARQIRLTQWFDIDVRRDWVAFAPYAGWYNPQNDKRLSETRAQEICDLIITRGYKVLQIGGPGEPRLQRATFFEGSYFESIRAILGCKVLLHTDSGCGWAISGYQFPQLGLYSHAYYGEDRVCAIQPVNPQGVYLSDVRADQIPLDKIAQAMDSILS